MKIKTFKRLTLSVALITVVVALFMLVNVSAWSKNEFGFKLNATYYYCNNKINNCGYGNDNNLDTYARMLTDEGGYIYYNFTRLSFLSDSPYQMFENFTARINASVGEGGYYPKIDVYNSAGMIWESTYTPTATGVLDISTGILGTSSCSNGQCFRISMDSWSGTTLTGIAEGWVYYYSSDPALAEIMNTKIYSSENWVSYDNIQRFLLAPKSVNTITKSSIKLSCLSGTQCNNTAVFIGSTRAYLGNITGSGNSVTISIPNYLNSYLKSCTTNYTIDGVNQCVIPIKMNASDDKLLQYSSLVFSNEGFLENSQTYNTTTYETSTEGFVINLTYDNSAYTSISGRLIYNGTSYTATKTQSGGEVVFVKSMDIPTLNTELNRSFYWNIGLTNSSGTFYYNTTAVNQTVKNLSMELCGASPLDKPYINFTFYDETTSSSVVASISLGTFNYYTGSGTVYETLTFINNTANPSYAFCLTPSDKSIYSDVYLQYFNSTSYPQRNYNPSTLTLTNTTTSASLPLLSTSEGLYVTFQVINSALQPISGVSVSATRIVGTTEVSAGIGSTGDDGSVTFWLNPNYAHTFTFNKAPYQVYTTTITPTQSVYTITLGGYGNVTATDYAKGITYSISPTNYSLENGTTYTFSFTIDSTYYELQSYGFNITDKNGNLLSSVSDTSTTGGTVSLDLNTAGNTSFIIHYYWVIDGVYSQGSRSWTILNLDGRDYSIAKLFRDFAIYQASGLFGLDEFGVGLICFFIILTVTGTARLKFGISDEATILGVIFSLVALLDVGIGILPNPVGAVDYFPTVFMGLIFSGFLFKEVFY